MPSRWRENGGEKYGDRGGRTALQRPGKSKRSMEKISKRATDLKSVHIVVREN